MGADRGERGLTGGNKIDRGLAGDGLDAARACGDGAFGHDFHQPDFARGGDMGAAAEFAAIAADIDDADDLAVFVAKEGEGALRLLVELGLVGLDLRIVDYPLVDELFDFEELRMRDGLEMRKIKAQPIGCLVRAGLPNM